MVESISGGGGRSCINASAIITSDHADALASELAARLASIPARGLTDPEAILSGFPSPDTVTRINAHLDSLLNGEGATDMTAGLYPQGRKTTVDGMHFLLPTVVRCQQPDHPLAQTEFPFPFVAISQVPQDEIVDTVRALRGRYDYVFTSGGIGPTHDAITCASVA